MYGARWTNKQLGAEIRRLRIEAGLDQRQLARRLDLSPVQIQKYEMGLNALSGLMLLRILATLEVSSSVLLERLWRITN